MRTRGTYLGDHVRTGKVGTLLALVGLLLLAGCASAGASPTSTSAARAKATTPASGRQLPISSPMSGPALHWRAVSTPPGFDPRKASTNILVPSPAAESDPTRVTAYACDEQATGVGDATPINTTFWATHDGGAHWAQIPLPRSVTGWCNVYPDQANTQNVLLGLSSEPPLQSPPGSDSYYVSFDGGATARAVPSLRGKNTFEFASAMDSFYVLLADQEGGLWLEMSHDGMQTWHAINPPASASSGSVSTFWLDQHDFALVAVEHTSTRDLLYTADEDGQHWVQVTAPGTPSGNFVASASASDNGQPWQLCGVSADASAAPAVATLACSTDSGHTWQQRARWTEGPVMHVSVVTPDGALFASVEPDPQSGIDGYPVFEMAPFSAAWEERGLAMQLALGYSPTAGLLWALPAPMMGSTDPQGRIFVASATQ